MRRDRRLVLAACAMLWMVSPDSGAQVTPERQDISTEILRQVRAIENAGSEREQEQLAGVLFRRVMALSDSETNDVSDEAIKSISLLLSHRSTSFLASGILARFGDRARGAIPALVAAIEDMEVRDAEIRERAGNWDVGMGFANMMNISLAQIRGECPVPTLSFTHRPRPCVLHTDRPRAAPG